MAKKRLENPREALGHLVCVLAWMPPSSFAGNQQKHVRGVDYLGVGIRLSCGSVIVRSGKYGKEETIAPHNIVISRLDPFYQFFLWILRTIDRFES